MALFIYNGINLVLPYHTAFKQNAVRDESGTDRIYTQFDLQVQTILSTDYMHIIAPDLATEITEGNAASVMNVIRSRLLQDRKTLSVKCNGVELIPANENLPGTVDAKNGPQPQSCSITQLTNTSFLVIYHIIAHYWEGPYTNIQQTSTGYPSTGGGGYGLSTVPKIQTGNSVLYNRWSETIDLDACGYTTRTRDGRFRIRSDNEQGQIADVVRTQMAVVGLPPGFTRKSARYTVSPDGLTIAYCIIDQEEFKMPPQPAFKAEGYYTESFGRMAVMRTCEVYVKLTGSKTTDQSKMLGIATAICANKLHLRGASLLPQSSSGQRNVTILEGIVVKVDMYKNEVECRIRTKGPVAGVSTNGRFEGIAGLAISPSATMVFTPGSDPQGTFPAPQYNVRGSADLLLKAAAYFDPSLRNNFVNPATSQLAVGAEVGTAGKTEET